MEAPASKLLSPNLPYREGKARKLSALYRARSLPTAPSSTGALSCRPPERQSPHLGELRAQPNLSNDDLHAVVFLRRLRYRAAVTHRLRDLGAHLRSERRWNGVNARAR